MTWQSSPYPHGYHGRLTDPERALLYFLAKRHLTPLAGIDARNPALQALQEKHLISVRYDHVSVTHSGWAWISAEDRRIKSERSGRA